MRVGYVRVSTAEQNPARQVELMKSLDVEKVFLDKISGKNTDRPQFNECCRFSVMAIPCMWSHSQGSPVAPKTC